MSKFNKEDFIKSLEDDESNYIVPSDEEDTNDFNFDFNFTLEQIKDAVNMVIEEFNPSFISMFDISIFLGNVAKKLSLTLKNDNLSFENKYRIVLSISQTVVEELESKGLIDLEKASEFKRTIKDGEKYKDVISSASNFMSSPPEVKHKLIMNAFEGVLNRFLK